MSTLDRRSGYFQLMINHGDIVKMAFVTKNGTYAFGHMPIGLSGEAPNFQKAIDIILKPVIGRKSDEMEIRTSSSDNNSSSYKSINFEGMQPRSNGSQYSSNSGYNWRPKRGAKVESRLAIEKRTQQGGPVRSRGSREKQQYRPYAEEQRRSSSRNTRSRSGQQ
ncbi:hypothetical protein TNCV_4129401 [Trichonephila clavipes]|nr:hypothetical protein TNCV_4129401 [Trichonephila clavipes]